MKDSKFISVNKSQVPAYVSQNGRIYYGKENNLVKFEANCEEGYWGYLTDKNGVKITRGKRLCCNQTNNLTFGTVTFERI